MPTNGKLSKQVVADAIEQHFRETSAEEVVRRAEELRPPQEIRPQCHVCKELIIAEQEMEGEVQYVTVDGKTVPIHEDCRYDGVESVGRGSPHGGCHGD